MNLNYNVQALGEYAAPFVIFKECVKNILKEYAETMMDKVAIDRESGKPDYDQVTAACKNMLIAYEKSRSMLDIYYCCYLAMAEMDKKKTEETNEKETDNNEGVNKAGD